MNERLTLQIDTKTTGDEALNRLSAGLEKVSAIADRTGKTLAKSGETSPFANFPGLVKSGLQDPLGTAESTITSLFAKMGTMGAVAGGFAAGLAVVGASAFAASRDLGRYAEQISNTAERTGLSTTQVQEFTGAARIAGVDIGSLTTAMRSMSQGMSENSEEGKKQKLALADIGITVEDSLHRVRSAGDLIPEILSKLGELPAGFERNALAVKTLGRGGLELLPLIGHLNELTEVVRRTGFVMSGDAINAAARYDDAFDVLGLKIDAAKHKLGSFVAGMLLASTNPLVMGFFGTDGARSEAKKEKPLPQFFTDFQDELKAKKDAGTAAANAVIAKGFGKRTLADQLKETESQLSITPKPELGKYDDPTKAKAAVDTYTALTAKRDSLTKAIENQKKAVGELESAEKSLQALEKQAAEAGLGAVAKLSVDYQERIKKDPLNATQRSRALGATNLLESAEIAKQIEAQKNLPLTLGGPSKRLQDSAVHGLDDEITKGLERRNKAISEARKKDNEDQKKQDEAQFAGIRSSAEHQARLTELRAKPGDEVAALRAGLAIRQETIAKELEIVNAHSQLYDLDVERFKLERESQDASFKYEESILELSKRRQESFRENVVRGFDDIVSGHGGNVLKSFATGLQRQIIGNAADLIYPQIQKITSGLHIGQSGTLGTLLKGTPFGADPLKGATDLNTLATQQNTAALTAVAAGRSITGGATGASGLGSIFSGASKTNPFVFNAVGGTRAVGSDGLPVYDSAAYKGLTLPGGSSGLGFNARTIGGIAAAGGGAFAAINDFRSSGVKNNIGGVGASLGAAAGVAALFGPAGAPAALGLGIAAMATSFIASIFPDPKKVREASITKALEQNKYYAPESLSVSQSTNGMFTDFDARGNLRQSNFRAMPQVSQPYQFWQGGQSYDAPGQTTSPYAPNSQPIVNITIHANDASSFVDMARRSSAGLIDIVADHVQGTGGNSRLTSALQYAMSS
jgi:hypothetical protein